MALATIVCSALATPKFINQLVFPQRISGECLDLVAAQSTNVDFGLRECDAGTGSPLIPKPNNSILTRAAGYGLNAAEAASYLGPTIVANRDEEIKVRWINKLCVDAPHPLLDNIDTSIHVVQTDCPIGHKDCCPIVTHLHGGRNIDAYDGYPDRASTEHDFSQVYIYGNDQPAANLMAHDHALGITRLNVYIGLALDYLLRDTFEREKFRALTYGTDAALEQFTDTTGSGLEMELILQDKSFRKTITEFDDGTKTAELFYQNGNQIMPEAFFDYMMVNGKIWPKVDISNRWYRLRILNASDSRFYALQLRVICDDRSLSAHGTALQMFKIGGEQGFLSEVVAFPPTSGVQAGQTTLDQRRNYLFLGLGARADVIIDASQLPHGCDAKLINRAGFPFQDAAPFGGRGTGTSPPDPAIDGQIMLFHVADFNEVPGRLPTPLMAGSSYFNPIGKDAYLPAPAVDNSRHVILNEIPEDGMMAIPILGAVVDGQPVPIIEWCSAKHQITENILLGDTEIWYIHNISPDAHPIHLHLVEFFVLDRCEQVGYPDGPFNYDNVNTNCEGGPRPGEEGPLDVVIAPEGMITIIRATFVKAGLYAWHCHILSHEDHDMMRPFCVTATSEEGREGVDCIDYWIGCKRDLGSFPDPPVPESALAGQPQLPPPACSVGGEDGSGCLPTNGFL